MGKNQNTQGGTAITFRPLGKLHLLDDIVFQDEDVFHWSEDRIVDMQLELIREAFGLHYERNADYRRYCDALEFTPERLQSARDLPRIPRITSTQFKLRQVRTCDADEVIKECVSSGTQGSVSTVYRDERTMTRFFGSIESGVDQVVELDDAFCVHLGPSQQEADALWFSYVMGTTDLLFPIRHMVRDQTFRAVETVELIRRYWDAHDNMLIIGAPVMFLELLDTIADMGVSFTHCEKLYCFTAGGWKKHTGRAIPRSELEDRLCSVFRGLLRPNIRDFYNMVELNTVVPECEHQRKHIPPWVRFDVFDPRTLERAAPGEMGMVSFLDPTATSYPGFIISDDLGRLSDIGPCECGRVGQTIEIARRVSKVESRGCALKIDRQYARSRQA